MTAAVGRGYAASGMSRTRLLLADDSASVQRVIELTFVDEDVDVVAVGGGRDAIEDIKRQPPDIVLADTRMPDGDGYEVADFVRTNPELARIPVVLLMGAFDPVDSVRAQEVASRGVLVKPFEAQQVIGTVRDLLGAAGSGPASAVPAPPLATAAPPAAAAGAFQASAGPAAPIEQSPQASAGVPRAPVPPPVEPSVETDVALPAPGPVLVAEGSVLADAFAALLAAEQDSASPGSGAAGGRATSRRYTLPDEVVSDLVERVAGHLTDTYIRDRATGIVSEVAERLVHDEIARTRGSAT